MACSVNAGASKASLTAQLLKSIVEWIKQRAISERAGHVYPGLFVFLGLIGHDPSIRVVYWSGGRVSALSSLLHAGRVHGTTAVPVDNDHVAIVIGNSQLTLKNNAMLTKIFIDAVQRVEGQVPFNRLKVGK